MEEQRYTVKKDIARRIKCLHLIFTVVVLYFMFHIVAFILLDSDVSKGFDEVLASIKSPELVRAHRGTIYSSDGEPLAISITRKSIRFDFGNPWTMRQSPERFRSEAKELSKCLASYFGDRSAGEYYGEIMKYHNATVKYRTVYDTVTKRKGLFRKETKKVQRVKAEPIDARNKTNRAVQIFRDVDVNEWYDIKQFPILKGNWGVTYSTADYDHRVYPQGNIALRTIGRLEHHRTYGIELGMRDTLKGKDGVQVMQTIVPGYKIRVNDPKNVEVQDGYDVVTTLDIDVQDVADNALREQLIAQNAMWGTTIVMEVATGNIVAMANLKRNGESCVEAQNYAMGVPVNPGSTFKLVSAMALLENGVPTSQIYNSGLGKRVRVGGKKGANVQDSHAIGRETNGDIDMRTAFAESANVYFTEAVYNRFKDNPVVYSDFCRKLHLDKKIAFEEMGARRKPLPHLDRKHHSRYNALVNMAYGYGLEVTPLHTITVYNAVANNGRMVAPRLVLRTERNGEVVSEAPVRVLEERICSKSTIDTLRSFMEDVSRVGTAADYFSEKRCSFTSGSKTGTAQVDSEIDGVRYRRGDGYYYGSMVTYLPADKPRYTIMTAVFTKKQSGKTYYGAGLAGPVQKKVATFLYNRDNSYAEEVVGADCYVTEVKGGNVDKMRKVIGEYGDDVACETRHGWGDCSAQGENDLKILQRDVTEGVVPNVVGMGLDDALYLLERSGLAVDVVGYGKVTKQSIAPKTLVANTNKRIKIELR